MQGSKLRHFKKLSEKSGIPCEKMLFFDDEPQNNLEVTSLGVTFVDAEGGVSVDMVANGLDKFVGKCE